MNKTTQRLTTIYPNRSELIERENEKEKKPHTETVI